MAFLDNYRPKVFSDLVFENVGVQQHLDAYAKNLRHDHLILFGTYGSGKSAAAEIIARSILGSVPSIIPPNIIEAAQWTPTQLHQIFNDWNWQLSAGIDHPVTVINEIDQLGKKQLDLRAFLDEQPIGRVILTTNHLHAVDEGLQNRSDVVPLNVPAPAAWVPRASWILSQNGLNLPPDEVLQLLSATNGSVRDYGRAMEQAVLALATPPTVPPPPAMLVPQPALSAQLVTAPQQSGAALPAPAIQPAGACGGSSK